MKSSNCFFVRFAVASAAVFLVADAVGQTTFTYDFNSGQSNFESTFSRNGASGSGSFSYSSTGGISGSGRIQPDGSTTDSAVFNTALSNTGTITISSMFKTSPNAYGSAGDVFALGLYSATSTPTGFLSGNMTGILVTGTTSGLASDSWYKMTATFTNNGSSYTGSATLQPFDSSGNSTGSAYSVASGTYGGSTLASASTIYAGIYGGTAGGASLGARAIDNFSVTGVSAIPEPSTYAAICGAAVLGLAVWRRRRRAA
jgi:hypothetical protein